MTITTTKQCPYCGEIVGRYSGRDYIIGPATIECHGCNKTIETGKKLWKQLEEKEQITFILREIIFLPLDILFMIGTKALLLMILYAISKGIFDFEISTIYDALDISESNFLIACFTLLALHSIYGKIKMYREIILFCRTGKIHSKEQK